MSYRLGVDLGTTFTAAAVANGMPPTMVGLGNRALQIPSVLFLAEDGTMLVGEPAERRGLAQPDRVAREFKRRIGDTVPVLVAGTPFSPQELTSRLLRHVVETAAERLGEPPDEVVLTHPANWGPYKLDLLDQAARLAGVERSIRCPEPLAAAAQYAAQTRVAVGDTIAVYDLGGGTFDACVLAKTPTSFALLGTPEGIEHLGGIDFDEALFQHVLGLLGDRVAGIDADDPDAVVGLTRLRRDCVEAKEVLSTDTDALLPVALPGISTTLRLTRSEFESLIRPALGDTISALERAVRSADRTPDQLRAIVLVGGSSRIPLIGELLHHTLSTPTAMDTHPKHDIALGAVQADLSGAAAVIAAVPETPTVRTLRADAPHPVEEINIATVPGIIRSEAGALLTPPPPEQAQPTPPAPETQPSGSVPPPPPVPPTAASSAPAPIPPPGTDAFPPGTRAPTRAAPEPSPGPARRRRLIILGAGAAAVIAGIVIGIAVVWARGSNGGGTTDQPTMPFDTSAPSTPAASSPAPTSDGIPRSDPIAPTQMLIQMQVGNQSDIWLGDTRSPAPVRRLTTGHGLSGSPALSPGFDSVIYIHADDNRGTNSSLHVAGAARLDGDRELFPLPVDCQRASRAAWDPIDPTRLAIACFDAQGTYRLRVMTTDGTVIRDVDPPDGLVLMGDATFSPDGRLLAFWAAPGADKDWDGGELYTVPVEGGTPEPLIQDDKPTIKGRDADPVFSPDGKYVAFRRRVPAGSPRGQADIFRVNVDGADLERLTRNPADEQDPSWSRDSRQIAYKSAAATPAWPGAAVPRVWVMNVDGNDQHPLWTKGTVGPQTVPAWTPR